MTVDEIVSGVIPSSFADQMTEMPVPAELPPLVTWMTELLGHAPVKAESLMAQVRWCWRSISRAEFDAVQDRLADRDLEEKKKPFWHQMRHCFSVSWPSDDVFNIAVVLRNPEQDHWCLPEEEQKRHPIFLWVFCPGCNWSRDVCKCAK